MRRCSLCGGMIDYKNKRCSECGMPLASMAVDDVDGRALTRAGKATAKRSKQMMNPSLNRPQGYDQLQSRPQGQQQSQAQNRTAGQPQNQQWNQPQTGRNAQSSAAPGSRKQPHFDLGYLANEVTSGRGASVIEKFLNGKF